MPDSRNQFSRQDIDRLSHGQLFHPNSPRFPHGHMRMVDRITLITDTGGEFDRGVIEGELDIESNLWFFDCHFRTDPVMPGCLGLDAMWQLLGFYLAWYGYTGRCRALGAKDIRFLGQVLPHVKLVTYQLNVRRIREKPFPQAMGNGKMLVDGELAYIVKGLHIGLFASEDLATQTTEKEA